MVAFLGVSFLIPISALSLISVRYLIVFLTKICYTYSMNISRHPVITAELPDVPISSFEDTVIPDFATARLVIGRVLPADADVYSLSTTENYRPHQSIEVPVIHFLHEYDTSDPESLYPVDMQEKPVVFAGKAILNSDLVHASGVVFPAGRHIGWIDLVPDHL